MALVRLPGIFTAQADICAAFIIAGPTAGRAGAFILLLLATSCFLSAGMALNDYFDAETDSRDRPERPIPSGRVQRQSALVLGIFLLAAGLCFSYLAGPRPFAVSLGLVVAILLYDGLVKDLFIGPLVMASCRYLNFLMGLSIAPFPGWIFIPLITGVYIFGVTILSRRETKAGRSIPHIGGAVLCTASVPLIIGLLYRHGVLPFFTGWCLSMVLSIYLIIRILNLLGRHAPENYQQAMKVLLLSIILLDTTIAAAGAGVFPAACILLLYLPARYTVRLMQIT